MYVRLMSCAQSVAKTQHKACEKSIARKKESWLNWATIELSYFQFYSDKPGHQKLEGYN